MQMTHSFSEEEAERLADIVQQYELYGDNEDDGLQVKTNQQFDAQGLGLLYFYISINIQIQKPKTMCIRLLICSFILSVRMPVF